MNRTKKYISNQFKIIRQTVAYNIVLQTFGKIFKWNKYILIILLILCLLKCRIYSFVTSSLPKEVKTFSIKAIYCRTPKPEAFTIGGKIFYQLKTKLQSINLKNTTQKADISFEGEILDYQLKKIGDIYEVGISMFIIYKNPEQKEEKIPITKQRKLSDGEITVSSKILNEIANEIVEEVWNKTVSKW